MEENDSVSYGDWMVTMLLLTIPVVNLIYGIYIAFSDGIPESKSNFGKAWLTWVGVVFAFYFLLFLMILGGASQAASLGVLVM